MYKAKRIDDARERLNTAKKRLEDGNYSGAMYDSQRCIELSVKALLDKLNIDYKPTHNVTDKIPETFEPLKPHLKDYEVNSTRVDLARAIVLLQFLNSIRGYLEYGIKNFANSKEIFNSLFAEKLASVIVKLVTDTHVRIYNLIYKIKE